MKKGEKKSVAAAKDARIHEEAESDKVAADVGQNEAETEKELSELDKMRDRLLRLQADFDNYRKRTARESLEFVKDANAALIGALLPILDHFGLALDSMAKCSDSNMEAYIQGVKNINGELLRTLSKFGLSPMESVGCEFDANIHEALSTMPARDVKPGCIMIETRKGYTLNGKVLRAPQVIVAAEPSDTMEA